MKLKTNNTLTKGQRKKNKNQKNKDQIEKYNIFKLKLKNEIENK